MKIAVMHVNSASYGSTSPTMRIARYVAERLGVPLIHGKESAQRHVKAKFDVLFVKYGMLKFSNHRDEALEIHDRAKYVINLENDYTFKPDKRFRKSDETWSTVEGRTRLINWNVLTRHPPEAWRQPGPLVEPEHRGLVYYGAHREDRVSSFERYFRNATYPLTISTFKGQKKFQEYGPDIRVQGAFRNPDEQAKWPATLYIEDDTSHTTYTSPATRFYECVMAGLAQLVDEATLPTLTRAGLEVPAECVVHNQNDVKLMLKHWREIRGIQRLTWHRDYLKELNGQLSKAMKASKIGA
jgi:hypothetical protein